MRFIKVPFYVIIKTSNCKKQSFTTAYCNFCSIHPPTKSNLVDSYPKLITMYSENLIAPPESVNGMKVLDREAFKKNVIVPCLEMEKHKSVFMLKSLKKYFLKINNVKTVETIDKDTQRILIIPSIKTIDDFDSKIKEMFKNLEVNLSHFKEIQLNLNYTNWGAESLIRAILPKEDVCLASYSAIGHIIHLNIKEHLLEYRHIIAEILLDKVTMAKTVIHKKSQISNAYRTFEMEVLAGEPNFMAKVIEYGVKYEFDFSKVYWNPRLSTERDRIIRMFEPGDFIFDIFAGVGPFSIRSALKQCNVFANDINPDSFHWLNHNIKLNKKSVDFITTFNKDGADFILNDVKNNLLKLWSREYCGKIHCIMNLPVTALTYLKYFKGLFSKNDLSKAKITEISTLPVIHCYFFVKFPDTNQSVFERDSGLLFDKALHIFHYVRTVSNKKEMHRVTFEMTKEYLVEDYMNFSEPSPKRLCMNN